MRIVRPGDPGYVEDCKISNFRFQYRPVEIDYCANAGDVAAAIAKAKDKKWKVRIRAGGHQHEGMCIANDVLLIDISEINGFDYRVPGYAGYVWVGAGASLKSIYANLWMNGSLFSGGGCGDVHVGGLTQGGGWGPASRKLGLTCDSLFAVEYVAADGTSGIVRQDGPSWQKELLWALRGGGGGNFGVVTKYCFQLHPWAGKYTDFTLGWAGGQFWDDRLHNFVRHWINTFPGDTNENLTTFLRVAAVDPDGDRAVIGGRYLGPKDEARQVVGQMLLGVPGWRTEQFTESPDRESMVTPEGELIDPSQLAALERHLGTLPGYQPGPVRAATESESALLGAPGIDLSDTCAIGASIRHKVSSGFARLDFGDAAIQTLTRYVTETKILPEARQYVSFHSFGGAVKKFGPQSSFAFRDRNFLLQYQAWWQPEASRIDCDCIKWIENLRTTMTPYTDGAFINFADRDIPLADYYGKSFTDLKRIKHERDPGDFFRFEMGIPGGLTE